MNWTAKIALFIALLFPSIAMALGTVVHLPNFPVQTVCYLNIGLPRGCISESDYSWEQHYDGLPDTNPFLYHNKKMLEKMVGGDPWLI